MTKMDIKEMSFEEFMKWMEEKGLEFPEAPSCYDVAGINLPEDK
jgi:hypothetical protein